DFKRLVAESSSSPRRCHGGWPRDWPHSGPRHIATQARRGLGGPVLWSDGAANVLVLQGDRSMLRSSGAWSRLGPDFCKPDGDPVEFDDRWIRIQDRDLVAQLLSEARAALADRQPR